VTDVTNASRTLLLNLHTLQWDEEVCAQLGVPLSLLPRVCSSSTPSDLGVVQTGLLSGVPITGCVGDQQAALIGQRCFQHADTKSTYGTGCFLLMNTGATPVHSTHGLLTTVGYRFDLPPPPPPRPALATTATTTAAAATTVDTPHESSPTSTGNTPAGASARSTWSEASSASSSAALSSSEALSEALSEASSASSSASAGERGVLVAYALEGAVNVAGVGLSWLTNQMGMLSSVRDIDAVAGSVRDTDGMYLVPAFEGLYAPRWRPDARGTAVGMTLRTTKAHFCRALLDGVALQCKEVLGLGCCACGLCELLCTLYCCALCGVM
jgi:glycerol kinase